MEWSEVLVRPLTRSIEVRARGPRRWLRWRLDRPTATTAETEARLALLLKDC